MRRQDAVRGGWMSILEVLVSGLAMLLLYAFVIRSLGAASFGMWSLVLATASILRLGDLGMPRAVVRLVAQRLARGEETEAAKIVETAALTLAGVVVVLLVGFYVPATWSLRAVVSGRHLPEAMALLPYAVGAVCLLAVGAVMQSALDGCGRIDIRNIIWIGSNVLNLILSVVLVPRFGLAGLAYAKVGQCSALVVVSWFNLRRELRSLSIVPRVWKRSLAVEMVRYSINVQVGSAAQILLEPLTKMWMTRFGGLEAVGYFEMANRLVVQVRRIPSSAAEVLVPVVANLETRSAHRIGAISREAFGLLAYCSIPLYGGVIAITPVISKMWLGRHEPLFIGFVTLLAAGWFVNTLASVAYFSNLGSGRLFWNNAAQVSMGVINVMLGWTLGRMFGANGVVLGLVFAIACGSALLALSYYREHGMSLIEQCTTAEWMLMALTVCGAGGAWAVHSVLKRQSSDVLAGAVTALVFFAAVALPVWRHPVRQQLMAYAVGWLSGPRRARA